MRDVRLHLIGGFELNIGGSAVVLQPVLQRLLAFVALTPRGVDREFAALQLWPDHCDERARASLRSALWRLRRLPVEVLIITSTRLRLNELVWVDAHHGIDELARGGDAAGLNGALPFQSLLANLLPDWYDDWLTIERERLRQLSLHVLESRARNALAAGDAPMAIHLSLTAMSIDPLRETPHRLLIEAHLAEGNQRDAHRTLDGYREMLAVDPRLAPSGDLEKLIHQPHHATAAMSAAL
jgi:DNA-binding SARP family transcriptional activator